MDSNLKIITTKDGSHSIFNQILNETYHSVGGALQESEFIYIDKGLKSLPNTNQVDILEIGFGTGLNTILTLKEANDKNFLIRYVTLEPFPLPEEIVSQLNYPKLFDDSFLLKKFHEIHSCQWEEFYPISPYFLFKKHRLKIEEYETQLSYDLVYYDAFAPSKQSEIWHIDNLKKIKSLLNPGGFLVTYCSNGQFKRDLKSIGFRVESLPGPLGKREITRAWTE